MTTATNVQTVKGVVKKLLPDNEGATKNGGKWSKRGFILTPETQGEKDLFISFIGFLDKNTNQINFEFNFDNSINSQYVQVDVEHFNGQSFNAKSNVTVLEQVAASAPTAQDIETSLEKEQEVITPVKDTNTGTDWAAKDRAQSIGGLMHDAAALVAPTLAKTAKTADVVKRVEETVLALIDVKLKAEAVLKG